MPIRWFSRRRSKVADDEGPVKTLYGWWAFDWPAAALVRKTDGATLRLMTEGERPDPLTRVFVFRVEIPGIAPFLVPLEAVDRIREHTYLTWRAYLSAARFEAADTPVLESPPSARIEWFLIDALAAWPAGTAAGMKPGRIDVRGGRVNGQAIDERWRTAHSCVSSDTRPRWPSCGLPEADDAVWSFVCSEGSEVLPDVPQFRSLGRSEIASWLAERRRNAPRLVSGERMIFPLLREWDMAVRWVYCDENIVWDRLVSSYPGFEASDNLRWTRPNESFLGTRDASSLALFVFPGEFPDRPRLSEATERGWEETYHIPQDLSQKLALAVSQASYALERVDISLPDRRSGERATLRLVPPTRIAHDLAITGGVLRHSVEEGLGGEPVVVAYQPESQAAAPPRFVWDAAVAMISDLGSARTLAFDHVLDGSPKAEDNQRFTLTYRDPDREWPLFVARQARTDGYRTKPWIIDTRPVPGADLPGEAEFIGMTDFIAAALNSWQDDERTGPAPAAAQIVGGYLNGKMRDALVMEVTGADLTRSGTLYNDPALTLPLARWSVTEARGAEQPEEPPPQGAVRPRGWLDVWLAGHPHGPVARADDGDGILALVGSITTSGHGGGTTTYWDYEDRDVWMRFRASRFGWSATSGGPIEGADPGAFDRLTMPQSALVTLPLAPELTLRLRRARQAFVATSGMDIAGLPIDGAIVAGEAKYSVRSTVRPRVWDFSR